MARHGVSSPSTEPLVMRSTKYLRVFSQKLWGMWMIRNDLAKERNENDLTSNEPPPQVLLLAACRLREAIAHLLSTNSPFQEVRIEHEFACPIGIEIGTVVTLYWE
jgi:hypothetical protein